MRLARAWTFGHLTGFNFIGTLAGSFLFEREDCFEDLLALMRRQCFDCCINSPRLMV